MRRAVTSNPFRVLGAPMLKPALSAARGRHTKDRPSTGSRPYEQHCRSAEPCSQGRDSSYAARLPKPFTEYASNCAGLCLYRSKCRVAADPVQRQYTSALTVPSGSTGGLKSTSIAVVLPVSTCRHGKPRGIVLSGDRDRLAGNA